MSLLPQVTQQHITLWLLSCRVSLALRYSQGSLYCYRLWRHMSAIVVVVSKILKALCSTLWQVGCSVIHR